MRIAHHVYTCPLGRFIHPIGKNLVWTVQVNGGTPAVRVLEKTGCPFASRKGESVSLKRGRQSACSEAAEPCVVNRHRA
jgi:hypothetical protein